jgi:predicted metal-dependent RNase
MASTIRFLGGADEVGASAFLLEAGGAQLVIDFGRRLAVGSAPVYQELSSITARNCPGYL